MSAVYSAVRIVGAIHRGSSDALASSRKPSERLPSMVETANVRDASPHAATLSLVRDPGGDSSARRG